MVAAGSTQWPSAGSGPPRAAASTEWPPAGSGLQLPLLLAARHPRVGGRSPRSQAPREAPRSGPPRAAASTEWPPAGSGPHGVAPRGQRPPTLLASRGTSPEGGRAEPASPSPTQWPPAGSGLHGVARGLQGGRVAPLASCSISPGPFSGGGRAEPALFTCGANARPLHMRGEAPHV